MAAARGRRAHQAGLPGAAAGVAARRAGAVGRGSLAALTAEEARPPRLRPHLRAMAASPRGSGRSFLRSMVSYQPVRMVRALVRGMKGNHHQPRGVLYIMDTLGLSGRTKGIIDLALHLDPQRYKPYFC